VCLFCFDFSKPRRCSANPFISIEAGIGAKPIYQEEWQKREYAQDINNPQRTGSDPLQKLQRAIFRAGN
jgi:hypothetical protein